MSKNKAKFEVSISKSVTVQLWGDLPSSSISFYDWGVQDFLFDSRPRKPDLLSFLINKTSNSSSSWFAFEARLTKQQQCDTAPWPHLPTVFVFDSICICICICIQNVTNKAASMTLLPRPAPPPSYWPAGVWGECLTAFSRLELP